MRPKSSSKKKEPKISGYVGLGLDAEDGEKRITRGPDFLLLGGSEDTHEKMQETSIRVHEKLQRRGKTVQDVTARELMEIFREVLE